MALSSWDAIGLSVLSCAFPSHQTATTFICSRIKSHAKPRRNMRPELSGEMEGFSGEPGPTSTLLTQSAGKKKHSALWESQRHWNCYSNLGYKEGKLSFFLDKSVVNQSQHKWWYKRCKSKNIGLCTNIVIMRNSSAGLFKLWDNMRGQCDKNTNDLMGNCFVFFVVLPYFVKGHGKKSLKPKVSI